MHEHIEKVLNDLRAEFETKSRSVIEQYLKARIFDWQRRHPEVGVTLIWEDNTLMSLYVGDIDEPSDELEDLEMWMNEFLDDYFSRDMRITPEGSRDF